VQRARTATVSISPISWRLSGAAVHVRLRQRVHELTSVYAVPRAPGVTSLSAELSQHVLTSGKRFACRFTDDATPTSNPIYESIGFCFVSRYDAYSLVPQVEQARSGEAFGRIPALPVENTRWQRYVTTR
jgi:hypothetical protein